MFWLAYRQGDTRSVFIVEASALIIARMKATIAVDGIDEHFVEGHALPPAARKIPKRMVGRLLSAEEGRGLLEALT